MSILDGVNILGDIITGKNILKNKKEQKDYEFYNSNLLNKGIEKIKNKAKIRVEKSRDPRSTGIINKLVRNNGSNRKSVINNKESFDNVPEDSEFSEDPSIQSAESIDSYSRNPNFLTNESGRLIDNRFHERQFVNKKNINDSFLSQYDDLKFDMKGAPASHNAVHRSDSGVSRLQAERNLALNGKFSNFGDSNDNTYGVVNPNTMTHNNMIPQFKSKSYGSDILAQHNRSTVYQRKMQENTGNDIKITRSEQKPLFSPLIGITNIYGMPAVTSLIQDRYMPGRERKNELPFRQQRVTTGLNLGYNEVNRNGDNFRPIPKTIDELRTADKQQKSYSYVNVLPKGLMGQERGSTIGDVKKYKAERTKYWGDYRLVPSLGYIRAPAIYGEVNKENMATVNRGTTDRTMINPAGSNVQQAAPDTVREKYKIDFKQNYKQAEPRNIQLVEGLQAREDEKKYVPDPTQRSQNQSYIGPIGDSQINKGVAFDVIANIFDTTRRNLTEKVDRYGAGNIGDYIKPVFYDPNDITKTTMRNIHDKYDRHGQQFNGDFVKGYALDVANAIPDINMRNVHDKLDRTGQFSGERGNGYAFDNINAISDLTMRNIHEKPDRAGQFSGDRGNGYAFDNINAIQDPNMRNIHEKTDRAGQFSGDRGNGYAFDNINAIRDPNMRNIHEKPDRAGQLSGDMQQNYAFDNINAIRDPNMRNIHEKPDRAGQLSGERKQNYAFDYVNATPDMTMKEIHIKTDRGGQITGDKQSNYVINYTLFTPDPTMKDIHIKTDRAGVITGDIQQNYAYDYVNATPDMTMKEIHIKTDRAGVISGDRGGSYAFDSKNVYTNQVKEIIAKGRAPTNSNYNKGPTMDMTTVSLCEPIQIKRDLLSSTIQINDKLPFILTSVPDGRTIRNSRMNQFTKDNLDQNPFINNLVHKSVPL
jgi:hypothetical protein